MSVKKDLAGRRSVQVETEVPGTPEQVWKAIGSAEGISSWFVPARIDTDANGQPKQLVLHFGPGMDSVKDITVWDPPHRFAAEGELGPGAPKMATEWIVEGRSGGTCIVRVVHHLFASTDDWDDQLEGMESGWPAFFNILRLWLTHFQGRPGSSFNVMGTSSDSEPDVWRSLLATLGLTNSSPGAPIQTPADSPQLTGVVETVGIAKHPNGMLLRIDGPAPGILSMGAHTMGGMTCAVFCFYFYGERAAAAVAEQEPMWTTWMNRHLPAAIAAP